MRPFFFLLSTLYIAAIFFFAGSPMVSELAAFSPYSLLHIPLYGVLTVLLIFSFVPMKLNRVNTFSRLRFNFKSNISNSLNGHNILNESIALTHKRNHTSTYVRFFIPVIISLIIAIADEIHQSFIPTRDASITDIFLDTIGIILALSIYYAILQKNLRIY